MRRLQSANDCYIAGAQVRQCTTPNVGGVSDADCGGCEGGAESATESPPTQRCWELD